MGEFFWEILEGIINKILSIIGSSLGYVVKEACDLVH